MFNRNKNSPGHRPTACKILSTSPCSRFLVLWTTGLQFWSPEGYQNGILRRRLGGQASIRQRVESTFWAFRKSIPKSMTFFMDFGSQNGPQIHLKIIKNSFPKPSRNHTPKNNTKHTDPDPAKPWKSSWRLCVVQIFTNLQFQKITKKHSTNL